MNRGFILIFLSFFGIQMLTGQSTSSFWTPADTLNSKRLKTLTITGGVLYASSAFILYNSWYRDYDLIGFHSFDDFGEWEQMDKYGHVFSTYFQSNWAYKALRWTGLSESKSLAYGTGIGLLNQTTIEIMDGFSENWGFSWGDMGANLIGSSGFYFQQKFWKEQRILFKVSYLPQSYESVYAIDTDGNRIPISNHTDDLFGTTFYEQYLKDYNAQTLWVSTNLWSFAKQSKIPKWLNVAVGFGAENMYGGYANNFFQDDVLYHVDDAAFPRHRQYYLSLDMDLTKIKTKKPFVKTLLFVLNVIKVPFPSLRVTSRGNVDFVVWD